jgi:hypothetical protein
MVNAVPKSAEEAMQGINYQRTEATDQDRKENVSGSRLMKR